MESKDIERNYRQRTSKDGSNEDHAQRKAEIVAESKAQGRSAYGVKASGFHTLAEEKARIIDIQQDIEADQEFESLKLMPVKVVPAIASSLAAKKFVDGFRMY